MTSTLLSLATESHMGSKSSRAHTRTSSPSALKTSCCHVSLAFCSNARSFPARDISPLSEFQTRLRKLPYARSPLALSSNRRFSLLLGPLTLKGSLQHRHGWNSCLPQLRRIKTV